MDARHPDIIATVMQQVEALGAVATWESLRVAEENGVHLDANRFDTLDYFFALAERVKIQEAA